MTVTSLVKHHLLHHHHPMAVNRDTTVRKIVSLPREMEAAIRTYRFTNQITTEAEAIRRLIELGLGQDPKARPTPPSAAGAPRTGAMRKLAERRSAAAQGRKSAERAKKRAGVKPIPE
jgi:hypothetical protein